MKTLTKIILTTVLAGASLFATGCATNSIKKYDDAAYGKKRMEARQKIEQTDHTVTLNNKNPYEAYISEGWNERYSAEPVKFNFSEDFTHIIAPNGESMAISELNYINLQNKLFNERRFPSK